MELFNNLKNEKKKFKDTVNDLALNWNYRTNLTEDQKVSAFAYQILCMTNDLFDDIEKKSLKELKKLASDVDNIKNNSIVLDRKNFKDLIEYLSKEEEIDSEYEVGINACKNTVALMLEKSLIK